MINNVTGGGQVFLHKVRMFAQVASKALQVSLLLSVIFSGLFYSYQLTRPDWDAVISYQKANIVDYFDEVFFSLKNQPDSSSSDNGYSSLINAQTSRYIFKNISPREIMSMDIFKSQNELASQILANAGKFLLICSGSLFILVFALWSRFGSSLKSEKKKEGSNHILTSKEVRKTLGVLGKASEFKIGDMPLVKDMETRHFLATGSTGSGKTNFIHNILPQIEYKEQPAIVIDQTGEMIAKYYNKERGDIIFNPFDERSSNWDFWIDCDSEESLERFAKILFGYNRKTSGSRSDPFWDQSSESVFKACVSYQKNKGDFSLESLNSLVRCSNFKTLQQKLKNTDAARYFESENSVTANSILAVLTTNSKPISYLKDNSEHGKFSLRNYFKELKQGNKGWLFLATKPSSRDLTLPLISCLTELAFVELVDSGIDQNRRVWFIFDELASLGNLPGLSPLMTEGRKYGACLVAALQSLNQLYEYYGQYAGSKIFGQFGTLCFFRNQEDSLTRMISNMCGSETILRQQKSTSFGASSLRDGVSYNEQQVKQEIVKQSDLSNLAVGECYMLLPEPKTRLARIQTPDASSKNNNEGFILTKLSPSSEPNRALLKDDITFSLQNNSQVEPKQDTIPILDSKSNQDNKQKDSKIKSQEKLSLGSLL